MALLYYKLHFRVVSGLGPVSPALQANPGEAWILETEVWSAMADTLQGSGLGVSQWRNANVFSVLLPFSSQSIHKL